MVICIHSLTKHERNHMSVYHYSRVSTKDQSVENQQLAAEVAGYKIDHWYEDVAISGGTATNSRKDWARMSAKMKAGDVLIVSAVDRIGRNTIDVLTTVEGFQKRQIKIIVLAYGSLDLTSDMGRVVLTMAAAFAQLEKSCLQERTKAGLARTMAAGTRVGPPLSISPSLLKAMKADALTGMTMIEIGKRYKIPRNTVQRNLENWGEDLEGYEKEYQARQEQYVRAKEKK